MATKEKTTSIPAIGAEQIKLLENLSNASAVPGDENEVRAIVLEQVKAVTDDVRVDALGDVIVHCPSKKKDAPRVMLAAHMDEVGFMIMVDDGDGLFQFALEGGVDVRQLPGKTVLVGREHIPGVIGARAIHLTTNEERQVKIPLDTLRIDVGTGETKGKIKPGDRAVFATRFSEFRGTLRGKALDDRLGVATLIELVKNPPENIDLYAVFTTQEEIGGRGAEVAAYAIHPDLAIAVDSTPAYDLPQLDEREENISYNTRLGGGPAIYVLDAGTISDPRLVQHLRTTAEKHNVPYQVRQPGSGGTDAGAIHLKREGIPSISVSVPGRYAHTAIGLAHLSDWQNTLALIYWALVDYQKEILAR